MRTYLLPEASFLNAFSAPMSDVTATARSAEDIWPYVDEVPAGDYANRTLRNVTNVYEDGTGRYHHVLIATDMANVFLAIVINLGAGSIVGHRLLDLNEKYGLPG